MLRKYNRITNRIINIIINGITNRITRNTIGIVFLAMASLKAPIPAIHNDIRNNDEKISLSSVLPFEVTCKENVLIDIRSGISENNNFANKSTIALTIANKFAETIVNKIIETT